MQSREKSSIRVNDQVWHNATFQQAWRVITTLGINIPMISHLPPWEQLRFQLGNRFCYNIAVSRVQYYVPVAGWFFFTWSQGSKFMHTVFAYNAVTKKTLQITNDSANFEDCQSIQVGGDSLYSLSEEGRWTKHSVMVSRNTITIENLAKPNMERHAYALANFYDNFVVVSGGFARGSSFKTVMVFDVKSARWSNAPDLNHARYCHSSSCVGDYVYVAGGCDTNWLTSVERARLDAQSVGKRPSPQLNPSIAKKKRKTINKDKGKKSTYCAGVMNAWESLTIANSDDLLTPRGNPMMAPINDTQLVIYGGSYGSFLSCGIQLDCAKMSITLFADSEEFKFSTWSNQSAKIRRGNVVALVKDSKDTVQMISYQSGQDRVVCLETFGSD